MGLLIHREIEKGCFLGIWEIMEDYETLFPAVYLNEADIIRLNGFKNMNRKVESLSVRALLQQMTHPKARIVYCELRKPYLADNSYNISISHSHRMTSILLGKNRLVGVDLEYMSHDIERIADKFLNEREVITLHPEKRKEHMYVHWCAKEALYKICDKVDINFQKNLTIKPFEPEQRGNIIGVVRNNLRNEEYQMRYVINDNYALVYCVK
ncbi:MAG: 4'-phosphopantetheinyl transferase superfamily protein [Bacteroidales bacterium]|jgi:phosphopantetheinyl transferase (holo-ACP synthase)|nr:4'-phosphopantetheinyl transferase superfamily protein [Bacteroidales bacterium]